MPAVVRGGRRQKASPSPRRGPAKGARAKASPAVPGKAAALGRIDLSPRVVLICLAAGVVVLGGALATGARAERIGRSVQATVDGAASGMGLKVDRLYVEGESAEATAAIRAAAALSPGQPMTAVNLDAVRERVEQVGWVKSARVSRLLPNTLVVHVVEHQRLAVWQVGGRNHVIDGHGQVIAGADAGRYPRLPLVVGQGAEQAAAEVLPLIAQRPRLQSRVEALVRVDQRRWDVRLKDGGLIQLPAMNQEQALIQLDALDQRERLLELGFSRIDLRTPDEVAVRPAAETAETA